MAEKADAPASKQQHKVLTPEDFITAWPLYTLLDVDGPLRTPESISFHCNHCSKETTWKRMGESNYVDMPSADYFYWVYYKCGLCAKTYLLVIYRNAALKKEAGNSPGSTRNVVSKIQKIGQFPALSVNIPKALANNLGSASTQLYKKALVNRNEGYGLGAVTYIRRVVEDKTDELIEVVAQLAESHNIEAKIVEQIRAAKNERTTYDNKLRIAATVIPDSLVVDGVNPLGELYNLVSAGVHDLTEEQCIAVADETKSVFEFTFTHLRVETAVRKDFVTKVKKWAGGKGPVEDNKK